VKRHQLVAVAAALLLTGCGDGSATVTPGNVPVTAAPVPSTATTPAPLPVPSADAVFNDVDVMFLQTMIPHHRQGVELARLARDRAVRTQVQELAAAIEVTQLHEVETMEAWLRGWNRPTSANPDLHTHHGDVSAVGAEAVAELERTTGTDFEHRFLNLLTDHQQGAVDLARKELDGGTNPQARDLADRIVRSRTAQIEQMRAFLQQGQ